MCPAFTINTVKSYLPPESNAGCRPAEADVIDGRSRRHVVIQMTPGCHNLSPAKGVSQAGNTLPGKIGVPQGMNNALLAPNANRPLTPKITSQLVTPTSTSPARSPTGTSSTLPTISHSIVWSTSRYRVPATTSRAIPRLSRAR